MKPAARIELNGKDVTTRFIGTGGALISLTITDEAGVASDTLELELDGYTVDAESKNRKINAAPTIDADIKIWLGYEPEPVYMGAFKVSSWSKRGPLRSLSVSAKAAEMTKEIKSSKTRSHHDTTLGAIVTKIANEHKLTPVIDKALADRKISHVDQQTESDMSFLSRLAKRNGAVFKLSDSKLIFTAKGSKKLPSGKDKPTIELKQSQLTDWEFTSEERGHYKAVKAAYMDRAKGKRVYVTAGSGQPCHRDKHIYGTAAEATAAARATLGDLNRGKLTGELNMPGNPAMFAETLVSVDMGDADVDGLYFVKSVTHTFSASGYTTTASLETDGSK
jgi:phage protein D